jgi:sugar/nucleoside kinase (ribokinase family)
VSSIPPSSPLHTVSIGGATFDLFVSCDHSVIEEHEGRNVFALPLGEKVPVRKIMGLCGGGASNTSVGLARLGCNAEFVGVVGDDQWGNALVSNMRENGVRTDHVTIVEHETSSFSLIFNSDGGERVIVYDAGTNEHMHDAMFPRDAIGKAQWVYLNHLHERGCVIQDDIIAMLAREDGPGLTWNPGGSQIALGIGHPLNRDLLAATDILLLNKEEAVRFTGTADVPMALRSLVVAGTRIVCITNGKHGSIATDGRMVFQCPNAPASVVDTTGAGDAFGTGLTWAIANGMDLPTGLKAASILAASVIGAVGAQTGLLTDIALRRLLETVTLPVAAETL